MIIPKFKIPLYGFIIVASLIIGILYIYLKLKKQGVKNKDIMYYFIMYITFAFIGGKIYTVIIYNQETFLTAGLSAYGGLVGVIIGSIIFEKILYCKGNIIKYTVLSLPLVYGLTKIACFISGCCAGIPYEGPLKVIYSNELNIGQFPIQIVETIVFIIIFIICNKYNYKKNITYITVLLVSTFKFLLDFLRYDHISTFITKNQIFSIVLIIITIIIFIIKRNKQTK